MVNTINIDKYGVPKDYVERDLENEIGKYVDSPEILAVVGPRQCGKSTLINHFLNNLEKNRKEIKINRIRFDNQFVLNLFETDIENFISQNIEGFDLVFIDEIQYSLDSGKKLKYIFDLHKAKIIISGSSAAEISIQSLKFLVGRILTFKLYPFSFSEFLFQKDRRLYNIYKKNNYGGTILSRLNKYLKEYVLYGGYPRVVLSDTFEEKRKILQEIYSTLLLREVNGLVGLSDNQSLINLIKGLSLQAGNLINYSELSDISGYDANTLKKTIKILEETFICKRVSPYFKNKRKEIYKTPKVYFYDSGLRNIAINGFESADKGDLYENFVFSELTKNGWGVNFWRTKSKAEVDFILEKEQKLIPIEVKSTWKNLKITRSFSSFLQKYSPNNAYFLSLEFESKRKEKPSTIYFLPLVKFIPSLG